MSGHGCLDAFIIECLQTGKYRVDPDGSIWDLKYRAGRTRKLKQKIEETGYQRVSIRNAMGKAARVFVHRVVAIALLGPPSSQQMHVDHINAIKTDNAVTNLEWVVPRENCVRATSLGLNRPPREEQHNQAKLTAAAVRMIHRMSRNGTTNKNIALELRLSESGISKILRGKVWPRIYSEFNGGKAPKRPARPNFDAAVISAVHRLRSTKATQRDIAKAMNISEASVSRIVNGVRHNRADLKGKAK